MYSIVKTCLWLPKEISALLAPLTLTLISEGISFGGRDKGIFAQVPKHGRAELWTGILPLMYVASL